MKEYNSPPQCHRITPFLGWSDITQNQIAERQFYISHSLDAMHTLILATRAEESTYLFMLNLSFTQKVTGMGSFVAHKVGRSKVKSKIIPLFAAVQAHY